MKTLAPLNERHALRWDALVAACPSAGFMQSWAWSRFKEAEGYAAVRLGLFEDGRLTGGALAYHFDSPAEGTLLAAPDGPVLDWHAPSAARDWKLLRDGLLSAPEAARAVALRVEPRLQELPPCLSGLPRAPIDLVPDETWLVDLGPEDKMLAAMKPKGRYNARLALRRGVTVDLLEGAQAVHELYPLLDRTGRFQDFIVEPKSFFLNLVSALGPAARVALARWRGMTLAGALIVRHGTQATYLYGGRLGLFDEVMANYALHWDVMRWAAGAGCSTYDLYGYVGAEKVEHPYHRFSRFKEKLGGRRVARVGSRDHVRTDRLAAAVLAAASGGRS